MKKKTRNIVIILSIVLLVALSLVALYIQKGSEFSIIQSGGRSFTAENPHTRILTVDAHSQPFQDFKLQLSINPSSEEQCQGCALQYLSDSNRDTPDKACSASFGTHYNPCKLCPSGGVVQCDDGNWVSYPNQQFCVPCAKTIITYPNIVYIETDNNQIAIWHKGNSSTLITNNFANDVNLLCPISTNLCTMTIRATASENKGGTASWSIYSESLVSTTTTTTIPQYPIDPKIAIPTGIIILVAVLIVSLIQFKIVKL